MHLNLRVEKSNLRYFQNQDPVVQRQFWIVIGAVLLLTRIPAAADYLSIDNVNLAFSLEWFDPLNHQPQPPGYPFFVLFARAMRFFLRSVEYTFLAGSLLVTALCLPLITALGRRMFSDWSGKAAAFLFLVNPVVWHTGADSPLRPYLALFSLMTAYFCWRCWNGERQYAIAAAVALGIGSGFRPELLPYLFPLWLISVWVGSRSVKQILLGTAIIGTIVLVWVTALVVAVGGVQTLWGLIANYLFAQSTESLLTGSGLRPWLRQMSRLVVWNGLAAVWWVWALPIILRAAARSSIDRRVVFFMSLWLLPGWLMQSVVHVAAPGHTLSSIPALCIAGAWVLSIAARELSRSDEGSFQFREMLLSGALIFNVMVFLNFFPVPDPSTRPSDGSPSITHAIAYATNETTLGMIRSMDQVASATLSEIQRFTPQDRPSLLISSDVHLQQWFLNWRILRYYQPNRDIWALADQANPKSALRVRRYASLQSVVGEPVRVPVPRGGRILWILDRTSPFYEQLCLARCTGGGQYVVYTDLSLEETAPFNVLGFEFIPATPDQSSWVSPGSPPDGLTPFAKSPRAPSSVIDSSSATMRSSPPAPRTLAWFSMMTPAIRATVGDRNRD
jgi:4-amino-4-deoxy-L-arabinose transferase-like glycosyltransferase